MHYLPIGIQTFADIIQGGFLYVDKTRWIYELVRAPKGVYFLSRPRRFGKSLLLSTLESLFQGRRNLFTALWIDQSAYTWSSHPVLRIDFSRFQVRTAEELETSISQYLQRVAHRQGLTLEPGRYYEQLTALIEQLAEHNQVVVLVDEYDKPIIDNLTTTEEARHIQEVLKGFYTTLKGLDQYLRFVFVTGVSKFSKVGVFSGLNNLKDITLDERYAALLGITQQEVETVFEPYLRALAEKLALPMPKLLAKIRQWYDGFCFAKDCTSVYNPFSLLLLFDVGDFRNYWFETGTPTFLIKLLRERDRDVPELDSLQVNELSFSSYDVDNLSTLPLLVQTGYLTIKGYDPERGLYTLGYPNQEVKAAFLKYLVAEFSAVHKEMTDTYVWRMIDALRSANFPQFFIVLNVFFANIPYEIHIPQERYYQTVFYLIFTLMNLQVQAELKTHRGRIDAVVELNEGIYIFEFKLDAAADAQVALTQIKERDYVAPYRLSKRPVYLVGAVFGTDKREIVEWEVEALT